MNQGNDVPPMLRVKRLRPDAVLPCRATPGSVGYDLYLPSSTKDEIQLYGQMPRPFYLGIAVAIPEGHYGRIAPRSGLAGRGVHVMAGVIDPDYRGELIVLLNLLSSGVVMLDPTKPIAQLILEKVSTPEVVEVEDLGETKRGAGGFGSTDGQ